MHSIKCSTGGVKNTHKGSEITPNDNYSLGVILKKSKEHPNMGPNHSLFFAVYTVIKIIKHSSIHFGARLAGRTRTRLWAWSTTRTFGSTVQWTTKLASFWWSMQRVTSTRRLWSVYGKLLVYLLQLSHLSHESSYYGYKTTQEQMIKK